MGFSDRQIRALQRKVSHRHIRSRVSDGKELSYIEGWFAIAEANRIFGSDGWDRETTEAKCVQAREVRGSHSVLYTARVRITVRAAGCIIVRDGYGTGEGRGNHLGDAHDLALKAAETDATKRALVTFGKAFGLALYSDRRKPVAHPQAGNGKLETGSGTAADLGPAATPNGSVGPPAHATSLRQPTGAPNGSALRRTVVSTLRGRIDKSMLVLSEPRRTPSR